MKKTLTYDYVKEQFEKEGYKLLSKKYVSSLFRLKVECPEGHHYKVTYGNFQKNRRCPFCYGNKNNSQDYIKQQFEKEGYKLLSKYKNNYTKILVECFQGHKFEVTYNNFQRGSRCPVCWELKSHSQSEKDCFNVVEQILLNEVIIANDRTQIINPNTNKYLELDIWIPSLNKAIEFNGEYWHNNNYSKYKDDQKVKQCKEKNIDLLVINYQNWIDNKKEEIEKLKLFLEN